VILAGYQKMMSALLKFQRPDGLWRQLVDDPEAWPETSGSAMFTYALVTGVKNGWLDKDLYGPVARKGWLALVGKLDADGNLHEVCVGTDKGTTREYYLARQREAGNLHGQAPMLWTAAALLR
jgi:rhamnogalacturonyl hydrolase YesR